MGAYSYRPIDVSTHTRVLVIETTPSNNDRDADIICRLEHIPLDNHPEYEALSYVWAHSITGIHNNASPDDVHSVSLEKIQGGRAETLETSSAPISELIKNKNYSHLTYALGYPRPAGDVLCDGVRLPIGGELLCALRQIRRKCRGRKPRPPESIRLWVDALCINQDDIVERSNHVKQMGRIYAQAELVHVWLGEEVSDAERVAFDGLNMITKHFERNMPYSMSRYESEKRFRTSKKMRSVPWDSLAYLLSRNWFRRVWVIQEIANAKKAVVHVGSYTCSWDYLAPIICVLRELDLDMSLWSFGEFIAGETIPMIERIRRMRTSTVTESSVPASLPKLLDLLQETRSFKCTLSSDKIYAVLGLASNEDKAMQPDYSLKPDELFKQFTIDHIVRNQSLEILYYCVTGGEKSTLNLPSWVPDWTRPCHHEPLYCKEYKSHASADTKLNFRFNDDQSTLFVQGRIVDTVGVVETIRMIPRNNKNSGWRHSGYISKPDTGGTVDNAGKSNPPTTQSQDTNPTIDESQHDKAVNGVGPQNEVVGKNKQNSSTEEDEEVKFFSTPDLFGSQHTQWINNYHENLRQWITNAMAIAFPDKQASPDAFEALWRAFICNQTIKRTVPPDSWRPLFSQFIINITSSEQEKAKKYEQYAREERNPYDLTENFKDFAGTKRNLDVQQYNYAYGSWCYNRRFFKSKSGRFGWAPDTVMPGDVVAVLNGLSIPLILRKVETGYEVVGDCYIHGLMDGEAVAGDWEEHELCIV